MVLSINSNLANATGRAPLVRSFHCLDNKNFRFPFNPAYDYFPSNVFDTFDRGQILSILGSNENKILDEISLKSLTPRLKHPVAKATLQENSCMPFIFANNSPETVRDELYLPVIGEDVKKKALKVTENILPLIESKRIIYPNFSRLVKSFSSDCDVETETLTALMCIKSESGAGVLSGLPIGMISENDQNFLSRARTIIRYALERKGIRTAKDIEDFSGWVKLFGGPGISAVTTNLSVVETIQVAYPGIFSNFDPPVRMWKLRIDRNANDVGGRELKRHGCCWVFAIGTNAFNMNKMTFDPFNVRQVDWFRTFPKYGIELSYTRDNDINSLEDTFLLAGEGFGLKKIFGSDVENGEIPRWFVTRSDMWKEVSDDGRRLIDDVSEFLITKYLPAKYPEMFDSDGKFILSKFHQVKWSQEYEELSSNAVKRSGIKVYSALNRVRPQWFGYGEGQVKPESLRIAGKWQGENKSFNFRKVLVFKLIEEGLNCTLSEDGSYVSLKISDFINWHNTFFNSENSSWKVIFKDKRLVSALRHGTTDDLSENCSMGSGISILFGKKEKVSLKGKDSLSNIIKKLKLNDADEIKIPLLEPPETKCELPILNYPQHAPVIIAPVKIDTAKTNPDAGIRIVRWIRSLGVAMNETYFKSCVGVFKQGCLDVCVCENIIKDPYENMEEYEKLRKYFVLNNSQMGFVLAKMLAFSNTYKSKYSKACPVLCSETFPVDC